MFDKKATNIIHIYIRKYDPRPGIKVFYDFYFSDVNYNISCLDNYSSLIDESVKVDKETVCSSSSGGSGGCEI